ncbi:MAG: uracil-DNA glycosylase [Proteobacteria bacterium]|jgi:uracil-DNA glycosylase|nr:uracil-DNA glycosylase [Pseudomonadota bacterium]
MNQFKYLNESFTKLPIEWQLFLSNELYPELIAIDSTLLNLSTKHTILPPQNLIFEALAKTPLNKISVVILGQDPYHGIGEANGLAFAVNHGVKLPPSLKNILIELNNEYPDNKQNLSAANLTKWAEQGVLLLNNSLTVIENQANSLANIGWNTITNQIIKKISASLYNVVFILWGAFAQKKSVLIDDKNHLILKSPHPSPLSSYRGFFGCNHFILANKYLEQHLKQPIIW